MASYSFPVVYDALFPHAACAVTLEALIDNTDSTVLFVVRAIEPVTQRLVGLWSSSPQPTERYLEAMHDAHREFLSMLWDNTGPFA